MKLSVWVMRFSRRRPNLFSRRLTALPAANRVRLDAFPTSDEIAGVDHGHEDEDFIQIRPQLVQLPDEGRTPRSSGNVS